MKKGENPILSMDSILSCNVMGLNSIVKQKTIKALIDSQQCCLVGLLETRIKLLSLEKCI